MAVRLPVKMLMQEDHWSQQARALGLILRCAGMSAVAYAIRRRKLRTKSRVAAIEETRSRISGGTIPTLTKKKSSASP